MRLIALLIALASLGSVAGCTLAPTGMAGASPPRISSGYGDKRLYRDVAARVAAGDSYYDAAPALQRQHSYPTKPPLTVRPPTLVWAAAAFGWDALRVVAQVLVAIAGLAWFFAVRARASAIEGLAAGLISVWSGWALLGGNPVILHERWAGMFLTLALALRVSGRAGWALAAAACAMALRELAAPFILLALAFSVFERRWREALGCCALLVVYGGLLAWHWHTVALHTLPGDLQSQGWGGGFDALGAMRAIVATSPLQWGPAWLAIALTLLAPLGWLALRRRDALFCCALYLGLALMIALFARPDNFYWGGIVQPGWLIGLALLPRALIAVGRWARDGHKPLTLARSSRAL